ncbi:HD domain-containing protein [Candidatus Poribacteria bacterium]|nr:HD domain-containing protein [Candidatus Poribacteria bacterium]
MFINIKQQNILNQEMSLKLVKLADQEKVSLYLVGGTVRDIVLGRQLADIDLAVDGEGLDFARKFANSVKGNFVPWDKERDTARIFIRNNKCVSYLDIAGIRGGSLEADLSTRDFTINAMAVDFSKALLEDQVNIIDLFGGIKDMQDKIIRPVTPDAIKDDPIRMIRCYRFAAVLGFSIHPLAFNSIAESLDHIFNISAERIRDEFFKFLDADISSIWFNQMDDMGLLERIFTHIIQMKGMEQNDYHHLDVWEHSLLSLEEFEHEPIPEILQEYSQDIDRYLKNQLVRGRTRKQLLKLAILFHDVGKPDARFVDENGRISFFNHNKDGALIMEQIGKDMRLANREVSFLSKLVKEHMYPLELSVFLRKPRSYRSKQKIIRKFIQKTGSACLGILLLSYADLRATRGPRRRESALVQLEKLICEIAKVYFNITKYQQPRLINGNDIINEFDIHQSPEIGEILQDVRDAQINGLVNSREDALRMVREIISENKNQI